MAEVTPLQLKQAGFTDADIAAHFQDRTSKLKAAGFTDFEINKYYGITDISTDQNTDHIQIDLQKNPLLPSTDITEENPIENNDVANNDISDSSIPRTLKDLEFSKTKELVDKFEEANKIFGTDAEGRIKFLQEYANEKYPDLELSRNLSTAEYETLSKRIQYQHDVNTQKEVTKELDKNWVNLNAKEKFEEIGKSYMNYFGISQKAKILDPALSTGPKSSYMLHQFYRKFNATPDELGSFNFLVNAYANLESGNRNIQAFDLDSTKKGIFQIDNVNAVKYADMYKNIINLDQPLGVAIENVPDPDWIKKLKENPNNLMQLDADEQKSLILAHLHHMPDDLVKTMLKGSPNEKLDAWEEYYLKYYNVEYLKNENGNFLRDADNELIPIVNKNKEKRIKALRKKLGNLDMETEGMKAAFLPKMQDSKIFGDEGRVLEGVVSKGLDFLENFYPQSVAESTIKLLGGRGEQSIFDLGQANSATGLESLYDMDITGKEKVDIINKANELMVQQGFGRQVAASILAVIRDVPIFAVGCFSVKVPAAIAGLTGPISAASVCGAGAFGLHSQQRHKYAELIRRQGVENYEQFNEIEDMKKNLVEAGKGALIGSLTMSAGAALRIPKAAGGLFYKPPKHLAIPAEIVTMVTVDSALRGEIPTARDFYTAAATIYGLNIISRMASRLLDIYDVYGVRPKDVQEHIKRIPNLKEDIARGDYSWFETQSKDLQNRVYKVLENQYGQKIIEYKKPGVEIGNEIVAGGIGSEKGVVIEKGIEKNGIETITIENNRGEQFKLPLHEVNPPNIVPYFNESPLINKLMGIENGKVPGSPEDTSFQPTDIKNILKQNIVNKENKLEIDKDAGIMNKNISIYIPEKTFTTNNLRKSENEPLIDIKEYTEFKGNLKNPVSSTGVPLDIDFLSFLQGYRERLQGKEGTIVTFPTNRDRLNHFEGGGDPTKGTALPKSEGTAEILYKVNFEGTDYLIVKPRWGGNELTDRFGRNFQNSGYNWMVRNNLWSYKYDKPIAIPLYVYNAAKALFGNKSDMYFALNAARTKTPSLFFSVHKQRKKNEMKNFVFADSYYNYVPGTKLIQNSIPEVLKENASHYQKNYKYDQDVHNDGGKSYNYSEDLNRTTKGSDRSMPNEPSIDSIPISDFKNPNVAKFFYNAKGLDLPALVDIYQALIAKEIKFIDPKREAMSPGTQGYFAHPYDNTKYAGNPKNIEIRIKKLLQEDTELFLMTTAHELGHAIDYIKNTKNFKENIMGRGNILGRLATLKGYMNKYIALNNVDSPISFAFIRQLKQNAEQVAKEQQEATNNKINRDFEKYLITPKTILDIYKTTDARAKIDPEFYDAFVRLKPELKKEITRAAMKKMMHKYLAPLAEKINKRITEKYTGKDVEKAEEIFAKAFENELQNRGIVSREIVLRELKKLSTTWKPISELAEQSYIDYRFSPEELMADFMMSFLLRPRYTYKYAPHATEAFLTFMDNKPEVKAAYEKMQEVMNGGSGARGMDIFNKLVKDARDGHGKLRDELAKEGNPQKWEIIHQTYSTHQIIADMARGPILSSKTTHFTTRPRWHDQQAIDMMAAIENYRYWGTYIENYLNLLQERVLTPLEQKGYDIDQLHAALVIINLVRSDQRANVASTHGLKKFDIINNEKDRKLAEQGYMTPEDILAVINKEKPGLEQIADEFFRTRNEEILPELRNSKAYDNKTMRMLEDNKNYITHNNLEAMIARIEKNGGFTGLDAMLRETKGSLGKIFNSYIATVQKDILLIMSSKRNREKLETIKYIKRNWDWIAQDYASKNVDTVTGKKNQFEVFVTAKKEYQGTDKKGNKIIDYPKPGQKNHPGKDFSLVRYVENGKPKGIFLNKVIADIWMSNPSALPQARIFARPFQYLFTEINPAFWLVNLQRDIRASALNIPGARLLDITGSNRNLGSLYTMGDRAMIRAYFGAIPEAWVSVFGKVKSPFWKAIYKKLGIPDTPMAHVEYMLRRGMMIPKTRGFRNALEQGTLPENFQFKLIKDSKSKLGYKLQILKGKSEFGRNEYEVEFSRMLAEAYGNPQSPLWQQVLYPWKFFQTLSKLAIVTERAGKIGGAKMLVKLNEQGKISMSENELMLRAVNDAGSPNFLNHGKAHNITNTLILYFNAWQRGVSRDAMNLAERPVEVGVKYAKYSFGPKIVQLAMRLGMFGVGAAALMEAIPEYDQQNYLVIPLGLTADGRVVYMRFALDETSRILSGTLWEAVNADKYSFFNMFDTLYEGGLPGLNPIFELIPNSLDGLFGQDVVPTDSYTGKPIIDPELYESLKILNASEEERERYKAIFKSDKPDLSFEDYIQQFMADTGIKFIDENFSKARLEMMKYLYNKYSGTGFYKFKTNDVDGASLELAEILGIDVSKINNNKNISLDFLDPSNPLTGPILNRFMKIGGNPNVEKYIEPIKDKINDINKTMNYVNGEVIEKFFDNPKELTEFEKQLITNKLADGTLKTHPLFIKKLTAKAGGDVWLQELNTLKTRKEKLFYIMELFNLMDDSAEKEYFLEQIEKSKQRAKESKEEKEEIDK